MISIEQVQPAQYPILLGLIKKLLLELGDEASDLENMDSTPMADYLADQGDRHIAFFAIDNAKNILGCITIQETFAIYAGGAYGVINEMYIEPDYRSKGTGALLINTVKKIGSERGWHRIDVTAPTEPRWDRTVRFYEGMGFIFTGPKLKFSLQ